MSLIRFIQRISAGQLYRKGRSSHSYYLSTFWRIVWLFQRRSEQIWPHYIEQVAREFNTVVYFCRLLIQLRSQIENEEVLRILIDHHHIEKNMLAPTLIEGNRLMDDLLNKNVAPHVTVHCADLMTTSGTKSYAIPCLQIGLRLLLTRARNRHSGPTNRYRGNPLFTVDVGSEIA